MAVKSFLKNIVMLSIVLLLVVFTVAMPATNALADPGKDEAEREEVELEDIEDIEDLDLEDIEDIDLRTLRRLLLRERLELEDLLDEDFELEDIDFEDLVFLTPRRLFLQARLLRLGLDVRTARRVILLERALLLRGFRRPTIDIDFKEGLVRPKIEVEIVPGLRPEIEVKIPVPRD